MEQFNLEKTWKTQSARLSQGMEEARELFAQMRKEEIFR